MDLQVPTRWTAAAVRREMARRTENASWEDNRYWQDFLNERRNFFTLQSLPPKVSIPEKIALEDKMRVWLQSTDRWWGGWSEHSDLLRWHLAQHLRARKETPASVADTASEVNASLTETSVEATAVTAPKKRYDPTRDTYI